MALPTIAEVEIEEVVAPQGAEEFAEVVESGGGEVEQFADKAVGDDVSGGDVEVVEEMEGDMGEVRDYDGEV